MKKLFLTLTFAIVALAAGAQVKFTVTGTCPSDETINVYNIHVGPTSLASTTPQNGKFSISGDAPKDAVLAIQQDGETYLHLFINDGTPVNVDLSSAVLRGSDQNNKLNYYDRTIDSLQTQVQSFQMKVQPIIEDTTKTDEEKRAAFEQLAPQFENVSTQMLSILEQIGNEKGNMIPVAFLDTLIDFYEQMGNDEGIESLLSADQPFANHPAVTQMRQMMEAEARKQQIIGKSFIDLEENDVDGKPHKLSEYCGKGNYVLVDFWASWCGPCMAEMPNVKENYAKYHEKGFNVVGLSFDRSAEAWKKCIRENGLDWVHLSDLKFWNTIAAKTYEINAIPASLLIDPNGIIVARDLRGEALGAKLKEIYGF